MKMFQNLILFTVIAFAAVPLVALGLVFSQSPASTSAKGKTLKFSSAPSPEHVDVPLQTYEAEDGTKLGYRYFPARSDTAPLVIFLHGSGWHGGSYQWIAKQINGTGDIAVAVPDLRGHGPNPQRRGDIDYIGQYEDDIAALAKHLLKPGQRFILAGHSSGGGLVVRFAGGKHGAMLDSAVLLSPYLKYDAPTMRPNSGGWAHPLVRRVIGLSILDSLGIHALDGLTVVNFNFPQALLDSPVGSAATTHYSQRLNVSYAPRSDYKADIAKLPHFLLLAGKEDEAFKASEFEPVMSSVNAMGTYHLLDGVDHLGIYNSAEGAALIRGFILDGDAKR
jgi:pimeloyl-ACP methyl ester carboxylesterase